MGMRTKYFSAEDALQKRAQCEDFIQHVDLSTAERAGTQTKRSELKNIISHNPTSKK
jgi:hypothetical protein